MFENKLCLDAPFMGDLSLYPDWKLCSGQEQNLAL